MTLENRERNTSVVTHKVDPKLPKAGDVWEMSDGRYWACERVATVSEGLTYSLIGHVVMPSSEDLQFNRLGRRPDLGLCLTKRVSDGDSPQTEPMQASAVAIAESVNNAIKHKQPAQIVDASNFVAQAHLTSVLATPEGMELACSLARINIEQLHGCMTLQTEAGELADIFKRAVFYGAEVYSDHVLEECGDILWGVAEVLGSYGYTMQDAMEFNNRKLRQRYPDKFDAAKALGERDTEAEYKAGLGSSMEDLI